MDSETALSLALRRAASPLDSHVSRAVSEYDVGVDTTKEMNVANAGVGKVRVSVSCPCLSSSHISPFTDFSC